MRCEVPGCNRVTKTQSSTLCACHYQRMRKYGNPAPTRICDCGNEYVWDTTSYTQTRHIPKCLECTSLLERYRKWLPRRSSDGWCYIRHDIKWQRYVEMLVSQGFCCAICKKEFSVNSKRYIDHDHSCCPKDGCSNCVRGILCHRCNLGLAAIERPGFIEACQKYLKVKVAQHD